MALFISAFTFAQGDDRPAPGGGGHEMDDRGPKLTPQERAKRETDDLKTPLQLTPDQYNKILAANTEFFTARAAYKASGKTPQEGHDDFKKIHDDRKAKVDAVLTPEQRKQYDQIMHERRAGMHGAGGPRGGGK